MNSIPKSVAAKTLTTGMIDNSSIDEKVYTNERITLLSVDDALNLAPTTLMKANNASIPNAVKYIGGLQRNPMVRSIT